MKSLVLIPGLLCDRRLWSNQITSLEEIAEIRVADVTRDSSIQAMAASVLAEAPERFALAGFSMGSQVALEIMQLAGERVERLGLLSATHGGLLPPSAAAFHQWIATIEAGGFEQYLEYFYPNYVGVRRIEDRELKSTFLAMAHSVGRDAGLRQMRALLAIAAPFQHLDQIRCPTVVIGGCDDRRTTPEAHEILAREIPGAKLVMVPDSAHFTLLEQPAAVTQVLRQWLAT